MKYIEYISESKYWFLWIKHSIVTDGKNILSYEMKKPLWKWRFIIYTYKEWLKEPKYITFIKEIPNFNLLSYKWIELDGYTCFEALNTIQPMPTIKQRTKTIFIWILILSIYWLAMFTFWYYWFTMSEEEFLQYKQELCLE
jgi:hypothetical protein